MHKAQKRHVKCNSIHVKELVIHQLGHQSACNGLCFRVKHADYVREINEKHFLTLLRRLIGVRVTPRTGYSRYHSNDG